MDLSLLQTEFTKRKALMLQDRNALRGLLNDCLPDERAKANQLWAAVECGVLDKIVGEANPGEFFTQRLSKELEDNYGYPQAVCAWVVGVWMALVRGGELPEEVGPISHPKAPQQSKPVHRPPATAPSQMQSSPAIPMNSIFTRADAIASMQGDGDIADSYTEIEDNAYNTALVWSALTSISLPPAVERIGNNAFANCIRLNEVVLPAGLKELGIGAFSGCKALKEIVLPEGVVNIQHDTFRDCISLKTVELHESVEKIELTAFKGCYALRELVIPNDFVSLKGFPPKGLTLVCDKDSTAKRYCVSHDVPYRLKGTSTIVKPTPLNSAQNGLKSASTIAAPTAPKPNNTNPSHAMPVSQAPRTNAPVNARRTLSDEPKDAQTDYLRQILGIGEYSRPEPTASQKPSTPALSPKPKPPTPQITAETIAHIVQPYKKSRKAPGHSYPSKSNSLETTSASLFPKIGKIVLFGLCLLALVGMVVFFFWFVYSRPLWEGLLPGILILLACAGLFFLLRWLWSELKQR